MVSIQPAYYRVCLRASRFPRRMVLSPVRDDKTRDKSMSIRGVGVSSGVDKPVRRCPLELFGSLAARWRGIV